MVTGVALADKVGNVCVCVVGMYGMYYPWRGSSSLGSVGLPLLALGGGELRW